MPRPVFIVGNKRSGTSHFVRMLNLHPQIFVSHESDIVWALYQFARNEPFQAHPWDSDVGLQHTLKACGELFVQGRTPPEIFLAVQQRLMVMGAPFLLPQEKAEPLWIGDKKPFQHTDPQLLKFICDQFPEAHFLHIVRHPFAVAMSSERFNQTRNGDFWLGLSAEQKVERWSFHEQQVQSLRESHPDRVYSLRYEDFCRQTEVELTAVFRFLGLSFDCGILPHAARQTHAVVREIPLIPCSSATARLAERYGYNLQAPITYLEAIRRNLSTRLSRQFAS